MVLHKMLSARKFGEEARWRKSLRRSRGLRQLESSNNKTNTCKRKKSIFFPAPTCPRASWANIPSVGVYSAAGKWLSSLPLAFGCFVFFTLCLHVRPVACAIFLPHIQSFCFWNSPPKKFCPPRHVFSFCFVLFFAQCRVCSFWHARKR